ncbi:MAG: 4-hydroxy-tetrahydrodipicolinate synthase [bacterium]|nr:MAG: 4-hydroxy-tetrahydrodipicolinate synthase [bacterium]
MFKGSIVAIVTPFDGGVPDKARFTELVRWHIENGAHGIVPCGSTGESATLDHKEHEQVIDWTVKASDGRIKVIAGTGSNSTSEAIELTRAAKDTGADGALLISPYYNKPTQEGVYRHHMAIADAVEIPQILYNVPGRTALDIAPETIARLAPHPNIVGIKEATGSLEQAMDIIALCPDDFVLLSGDDSINFPLLAVGGKGSISVTANVWPKKMAMMHNLFFEGKVEKARELHYEMRELHKAMFIETNPIPVKTAVAMMGKIKEEFRLPLTPMSDANKNRLETVLRNFNLLVT